MNISDTFIASFGAGTIEGIFDNRISRSILIYRCVYLSLFLIIGIVGNGASFFTMLTSTMRRHSYAWYLLLLAVSDTLVLIIDFLPVINWVSRYFQNKNVITFRSAISCRLIAFFDYFPNQLSSISIVSVSYTHLTLPTKA